MMTADDIRRIMRVGEYKPPLRVRAYERVLGWLERGRPLRGLAVAMVVGGGLWYGLIWALLVGYKLVGR